MHSAFYTPLQVSIILKFLTVKARQTRSTVIVIA